MTAAATLTPDQVSAVVAGLTGHEVARVTRLAGSVANQDFLVEAAAGSRVVLKAGPEAEIAAEAWACTRLGGLGVPVPPVIAVDLGSTLLGRPFVVLGFVAGGATSDLDVVREAGACLRRIHQQELPGWGSLVVRRDQAAGRFVSWRDDVEDDLAALPQLVEAGVLERGLAEQATLLVARLTYDGPGVLLHRDLKPAHLFGRPEQGRQRLSAVIDWGDASVGDPDGDIARLSMAGPEVTRAFLDGYGRRLTNRLAERLARYRILWSARALSHEFHAGGDWFEAYRGRIREAVALLGG